MAKKRKEMFSWAPKCPTPFDTQVPLGRVLSIISDGRGHDLHAIVAGGETVDQVTAVPRLVVFV